MSESRADVFDEKFGEFARWQASPWGRLRYTTAAANLIAHLPVGPLEILDVGGGNGLDALELAARGHRVTIADISEQSLAEARAAAADRGLDDRVTTRHTSLDTLGDEFGRDCFDVLLCHNLIQYLPDPAGVIAALAVPLRTDGVLSVIAPNADADPLLTAVRGLDPDGALRMLDAPTRYSVAYETTTCACYPDQVKADLAAAGFEVIAHRGIRTVCDYILDDDRKSDPEFYRQLERLELTLATRAPYIHLARFFQFITKRSAPQ
ncbi:methyltransferase domain-containing protein [Nocardia asiatica]|uniref:methyltransferase domain-containing protein n=1 Tax=Nocardia asiatica TaxID=209252 RepID=UPI002453EC83|nr:methyltransferase domain-containing protein [Nocardia asiatica]